MSPRSKWRDCVRRRLGEGGWIALRDLFDECEPLIPLHHAYRRAHFDGRPEASMFDARFRLFTTYLSKIDGLETDPPRQSRNQRVYHYRDTRIRLPDPLSAPDIAADNRAFWARLREL